MKKVKIDLTLEEAWGLIRAASNSVDHPDAMEAIFQSQKERNAAYRAYEKLRRAWAEEKNKQNAK